MKTGFMGGSFDPPHMGHLIVAADVKKQLQLDELVFIPTAVSPFKNGQTTVSGWDRIAMLRLALGDAPGFSVCSFEVEKGGTSYTADTVHWILNVSPYKKHECCFLVGADSLINFDAWRNPEWILDHIKVVAVSRPGFDKESIAPGLQQRIQWIEAPLVDVSSSQIRHLKQQALSINFYVPDAVARYIDEKGLYHS